MTQSTSSTISKLSLSSEEILGISQEISKRFSPVVSAKSLGLAKRITLTAKELCEISEDITRKYTPKLNSTVSSLVLLPIDPQHLYVAWNLGNAEKKSDLKDDSHAIVVRIYPKPDENVQNIHSNSWFDVAIDHSQTRQKVLVPKEHVTTTYTAAIGKSDQDGHLTVFATSKNAHVPHGNLSSFESSEIGILSSSTSQFFSSHQEKSANTNKIASGQGVK